MHTIHNRNASCSIWRVSFVLKAREGFTLFEVLIYIALFSLVLSGTLVGAFYLIDSSARTRTSITLEQEANFIYRKVAWTLNGAEAVSVPERNEERTGAQELVVDGITFATNQDNMLVMDNEPLTASKIAVEHFFVERASLSESDSVSFSFVLSGVPFPTSTHFIR